MFELAYQLGLDIRQVEDMDYTVFIKWLAYFEKRPVGWRDDLRAYHLLQAQGVKERPWKIFDSLKPIFKKDGSHLDTLLDSNIMKLMIHAKGGEELPFFKGMEDV
jgi:hypothetical protein